MEWHWGLGEREREMDESPNFSLCPSPAKPDERERDNSA
jgi:hypothetical protein